MFRCGHGRTGPIRSARRRQKRRSCSDSVADRRAEDKTAGARSCEKLRIEFAKSRKRPIVSDRANGPPKLANPLPRYKYRPPLGSANFFKRLAQYSARERDPYGKNTEMPRAFMGVHRRCIGPPRWQALMSITVKIGCSAQMSCSPLGCDESYALTSVGLRPGGDQDIRNAGTMMRAFQTRVALKAVQGAHGV